MSAAEGASKASNREQANERAVRAKERMDERLARYSRPDSGLCCPTVKREAKMDEGKRNRERRSEG